MANYDLGLWESVKGLLKLIFVLPFLIAWDKAKEGYGRVSKAAARFYQALTSWTKS